MLNQSLQQKMLQKLSPQQILLMKLLQIPTLALEQRIKQEVEENPVLEIDEDSASQNTEDIDPFSDEKNQDGDDQNRNNEVDIGDYLDEDDIPGYRTYANNQSPDSEYYEIPVVSDTSFHESLISQLGLRNLDPESHTIGVTIIGNLDEAGYLQRDLDAMVDDLAFSQGITTTRSGIDRIVKIVQQFEPAGVGAQNLQECLLLQLQRFGVTPQVKLATIILEKYFEDFIKKRYDKIQKRLHISEDELRDAINEILKLNPKPGSSFSDNSRLNQYIIPDFIVSVEDGKIELSINQRNIPELKLSRTYLDMLGSLQENRKGNSHNNEAALFIKQKIDSARWFIDAIKQRQNTLYTTMNAIIELQKDYFLEGDETQLKPMILKDVAEQVNLDISTVSRVANSKYVQTPYGTFLLKSFFSESIQNDQGEEISTREIKKILSDCIAAEDKSKPITDEELTLILKKKGYPIARRTAAKYREQLNIPVARLRKNI